MPGSSSFGAYIKPIMLETIITAIKIETNSCDFFMFIENKKKVIQQALGISDVKVFSGNPYGYRNRMDFIFHQGGLGLREKGKWWKVQVYDQAGGLLQFEGETTGKIRAMSQNPVLVLEMQGDTTGELKRRKIRKKS